MLHRHLAALLLLPASFRVHRSFGRWRAAWQAGPYVFFRQILNEAPACVHRGDGPLVRLTCYYPMRLAQEVLAARGCLPGLRAGLHKLRHRGPVPSPAPVDADRRWQNDRLPLPALEELTAVMADPALRVISFDIFDTLLVRHVLRPHDVFSLVAARVDARHGVHFQRMRAPAEAELGLPNPTLEQIHAHMARRHNLSPETAAALREAELRCERDVLRARPAARALYDAARRLGKRIIAVSDMYLPAAFLRDVLRENGLAVDALYVSCEQGARKSDGALYDRVAEQEGCAPGEMLHFGDNRHSDVEQALKRGVCAHWLPSVRALACPTPELWRETFAAARAAEPRTSPYLALALARVYGDQVDFSRDMARFASLAEAGELLLAPLLTAFAVRLATDKELTRGYGRLYFAARDGWLPFRVYERVRRRLGGLPAVYFAAGRRAYSPFLYDDFPSYLKGIRSLAQPERHTLRHVLLACLGDGPLTRELFARLGEEELARPFLFEKRRCLAALRPHAAHIDALLRRKRERIRRYYQPLFAEEGERVLVFDLGYAGSIGEALHAATGKIVDKLYFWSDPENDERDRRLGSTTRCLLHTGNHLRLLLEELFSPARGGVIDFTEDGRPVYEDVDLSPALRADMEALEKACCDYADAFCDSFADLAPSLALPDGDAFLPLLESLLFRSPFCNERLLRDIIFPDPVHCAAPTSLQKKQDALILRTDTFAGTGFLDPALPLAPLTSVPRRTRPVGLHVHLHNFALAGEFLRQLRRFPAPFDLFLTLTDARACAAARRLFAPALLPAVREVHVLLVENRGRDVAPWIIGMRPFQHRYDLFCHVHGKQSPHLPFGDAWRRYLLHHLLHPAAVSAIMAHFAEDARLGCVFPPICPELLACMRAGHISPGGHDGEVPEAEDLLRRLGLRPELCRADLCFSAGTMYWYRPEALRQLFTFDLALEEFPAEPIGIGGTIAHALERLPVPLVRHNGYEAGLFALDLPPYTDDSSPEEA